MDIIGMAYCITLHLMKLLELLLPLPYQAIPEETNDNDNYFSFLWSIRKPAELVVGVSIDYCAYLLRILSQVSKNNCWK